MEPNDVLHFWFEESGPKDWFAKNEAFDKKIKERFLGLYWEVFNKEKESWKDTPQGRLALILVLDQFARNMFRDDPQAFAGDALAFAFAVEGKKKGDDKKLFGWHRYFFYLPYMHSESREAHRRAFWFFWSLPFGLWKNWISYEGAHRRVIERFGRYPHRNAVLGRESTAEEKEFLKDHPGW